MHQSSLDKMQSFRKDFLDGREDESLRILDLGSADVNKAEKDMSYRSFFDSPKWNYVGVDMAPGKNVDILLSDTYDWREIETSSVDVLVSGQAFEHIEYFWLTMLEIERVLKPGGVCCVIAPSGGYEHRYPVDCWRFYPDGLSALARFVGMEVLKVSTQWEEMGYKDGSDDWKDSMLVCKKPLKDAAQERSDKIEALKKLRKGQEKERSEKTSLAFNPLEYAEGLFKEPWRLTDITYWHGHIPFAFVVMQVVRPEIFVELGTHKGDSYFAFCQAVNALKLDTKCFAVDTWKGDLHIGEYAESIYNEVKSYHDSLFQKFSKLCRKTFEEALPEFQDGSIDLLHIDGLHTYEAVKQDFESWLPKMSKRGVVLFHDTVVFDKNYGVWKFWSEIKDKYPSFEFTHSNGLGILAVGSELSSEAADLIETGTKAPDMFKAFFETLSIRFAQKTEFRERLSEKDDQIASQERVIVSQESYIKSQEKVLQDFRNSFSWRITAPLRKIMDIVKK